MSFALLGCPKPPPRDTGPSDEARQRYARHQISYALSFRSQGRHESAEHALDAALAVDPDNARARRLMAVVLEDLGRLAEAQKQRARADAVDPPPPLPPDRVLDAPSKGLLVVIPPPESLRGRTPRIEGGWPGGEAVAALLRRLHIRLPDAEVVTVDPATLGDVQALLRQLAPRAVLSLRIDRAYCGDNEKDGPFSLAWIRLAAAAPDGVVAAPDRVRHVEWIPPPQHCIQLPIGRALEQVLDRAEVKDALGSRAARFDAWPASTVRALFPGLSVRIAEALEQGRARLATGRLNEALESFHRAAEIDPFDPNVRAYVQEAELTLAMARELLGEDPQFERSGDLDPQLTAVQRSVAEQMLSEERSRRDELLAALLVLDSAGRAPPAQALENLRSTVMLNPGGHAERLAASLGPGPFEVRAYFGPTGGTLARYWFSSGANVPVLREEDSDGDGTLDRWQGYVGTARRHLWEDRQGLGWPDLHMTFAAGGEVESIEVDRDGDRRSERLFLYERGMLVSESRDTDDDGHLDRVEFFDPEGFVVRREDDLDGDGEPDVKSYFDGGRLVRREIVDLELIDELTQ
ncbi:MAG: tetratricopeptide repeat protein [Deltaproteobacteria bacterium]|nr:tetratricopeptide repeat protein [Deltaproteobacteria bacterium]MBW2448293.1 tetratricopeptide repeat protein [Deltaproteobacteria bacterium]